jgi:hypothetical protein
MLRRCILCARLLLRDRQFTRAGVFVWMIAITTWGFVSSSPVPIVTPSIVDGFSVWEGIGELVGSSRVCQTFVARYDGLSFVRVRLNNYGRRNTGPFHFALRTRPDAPQDILTFSHDASQVENNAYHTVEFPPIHGSAGRSYCFCLEAPKAELLNSITALGVVADMYPHGEAIFRGMWGESAGVRDLDFHLGYRPSMLDRLIILSERLPANKPMVFGSRWFYVLLGLAYLAFWYLVLVKIVMERGKHCNRGH